MSRLPFLFAAAAIWLSGCSTTVDVRDISSIKPDADVPGIPFRMREPCTLRVFQLQDDGRYRQVHVQWLDLPEEERLYALNIEAAYFSDHDLTLKLRDDNTLDEVDLKTELKLDAAIAELAAQGGALSDAALTFDRKKREAEAAEIESRASLEAARAQAAQARAEQEAARQERAEAPIVAQEGKLAVAVEALNSAEAAERALDALPPDAEESARAECRATLRLLRLRANQAYRAAGLAEPYPGVFP
jgi:hypothetical protein